MITNVTLGNKWTDTWLYWYHQLKWFSYCALYNSFLPLSTSQESESFHTIKFATGIKKGRFSYCYFCSFFSGLLSSTQNTIETEYYWHMRLLHQLLLCVSVSILLSTAPAWGGGIKDPAALASTSGRNITWHLPSPTATTTVTVMRGRMINMFLG